MTLPFHISLNVTLPTRFKRPGGYAFVGYKTEEQANKAVEELNDQGMFPYGDGAGYLADLTEELNERKVQLNLARSKEESASRRAAADEKRNAARSARREASGAAATTEGEATEGGEAGAKPKKKKPTKVGSDVPKAKAREGTRQLTVSRSVNLDDDFLKRARRQMEMHQPMPTVKLQLPSRRGNRESESRGRQGSMRLVLLRERRLRGNHGRGSREWN